MLEKQANSLTFLALFIASKVGATGLTVTVDVWEITQAGTATEIVTGGSATEVGDGLYRYILASGSVDANAEYICVFKTANTSVDQQHLAAVYSVGRAGVANLDAAVSAVETDTQDIQSRLPASLSGDGYMFSEVRSIRGDGDAAVNAMYYFNGAIIQASVSEAGQTTTFETSLNLVGTFEDNAFENQVICFLSGDNVGSKWRVTASDGATGDLTIDGPLPEPTQIGDQFLIMPLYQSVDVEAINESGAAAAALATNIGNLDGAISDVAAAVWEVLTATLVTDGSIGEALVDFIESGGGGGGATAAEIWDYLTANILTVGSIGKLIKDKLALITTATEITVDAPVNGGMLTITKAVSLDSGLLDVTVPGDWTKCLVTAKKDKDDPDTAALFQIVESNPGAGTDGLLYLNGAAGTAGQGSLIVDEDNNQVQFTLTDNATAQLPRRGGHWDIKFLKSDGESTRPVAGLLQIVLPVTLTI